MELSHSFFYNIITILVRTALIFMMELGYRDIRKDAWSPMMLLEWCDCKSLCCITDNNSMPFRSLRSLQDVLQPFASSASLSCFVTRSMLKMGLQQRFLKDGVRSLPVRVHSTRKMRPGYESFLNSYCSVSFFLRSQNHLLSWRLVKPVFAMRVANFESDQVPT